VEVSAPVPVEQGAVEFHQSVPIRGAVERVRVIVFDGVRGAVGAVRFRWGVEKTDRCPSVPDFAPGFRPIVFDGVRGAVGSVTVPMGR
jgi:hypothetical protein